MSFAEFVVRIAFFDQNQDDVVDAVFVGFVVRVVKEVEFWTGKFGYWDLDSLRAEGRYGRKTRVFLAEVAAEEHST